MPYLRITIFLGLSSLLYANYYNIRSTEYKPSKYLLVDVARFGWHEARVQAIRECGLGHHTFCMRVLGENLLDENLQIRQESVRNLGFLKAPECLPYVEKAMPVEKEQAILADYIWLVGEIGVEEGRPLILGYLSSEEPFIRRTTADSLARIGKREDLDPLAQAYDAEKDERVKLHLLAAILRMEPNSVKHRIDIIRLLSSPDKVVRYYTAIEIKNLKMKDAHAALVRAREIETEEDVNVKLGEALKASKFAR